MQMMAMRFRGNSRWSEHRTNSVFLALSFVVLLGLAYFDILAMARDRNIVSDWQAVRGTITDASVEPCGKFRYTVRPRYVYEIGPFTYSGDERAAGTGNCSKLKEAEKIAREIVGTSAVLHVDPSSPHMAVFGSPQLTVTRYLGVVLTVALTIAAAAGLVVQFWWQRDSS